VSSTACRLLLGCAPPLSLEGLEARRSAYLDGVYPPGKQDAQAAAEVLGRLIEAHGLASRALRTH
jgi:hypothetical protein